MAALMAVTVAGQFPPDTQKRNQRWLYLPSVVTLASPNSILVPGM
jgi:hypothetical protein